MSSVKKAETGEALIVRLYNPSEAPTQATLHLPFAPASVQLTGLDEEPQPAGDTGPAPVLEAGGKVSVVLPPKKIVSFRMERP